MLPEASGSVSVGRVPAHTLAPPIKVSFALWVMVESLELLPADSCGRVTLGEYTFPAAGKTP